MEPQLTPRRSFAVWPFAGALVVIIAVAIGVVWWGARRRTAAAEGFMEGCTQSCRPGWQAAAQNPDPGNPFRGISDEQVGAVCQCLCEEGRRQMTPAQRERLEKDPEQAKQDAELMRGLNEVVGRAAEGCVPRVFPSVKKRGGAGE